MKAKLVTSLTALFAGAGLALAQTPPASPYRLIDHSGSGNVSQASASEPVSDTNPRNRPTLSLAAIAGPDATEPAPQAPAPGCKDAFDSHHVEPCNRFWASAEYLVWWTKSSRVPPLAATVPGQFAGRDIPADQLTPIFGGTQLDFQAYSGARFSVGYALDDEGSLGIDANYFFTETRVKRFIGGSTGDPLLGPTFFDLGTNLLTLVRDADPGRFRGVVSVEAPSRFWGTEANVSVGIQPVFSDRLRLFGGFRYFELTEALTRVDQAMGVGNNAGVVITGLDHFGTRNQFYGGQIGFAAHSHVGVNWTLDLIGKFAMGGVREFINIDGASTLIQPGQPITLGNGNLLALGTNSGHFRKSKFAVLPELTVNLGYRITSHLNAFIGYNLIYLDKVARPADQIDFGVNTSQITFLAGSPGVLTGARRPAPLLSSDSFWAQGMNFGLEFSY